MAGYFYQKMVFPKVKRTIEKQDMLSPGDKVLVGVSGGPDSVCLLHVLDRLAREMGLSLHIVHINHGIRKREAKRDEKFVSDLADRMGIPISMRLLDVPSHARKKKLTLEEAGRDMRYQVFDNLARKLNAKKIALGHTASDQVETVLMRLLRGSGPQGMSGIPSMRKMGNAWIIRPLIEVSREEVLSYLKKNNLSFCLDTSNRKIEYFRNKIRVKLLPLLRDSYNKNINGALLRLSEIMKEENAYWDGIVGEISRRVISGEPGKILIDLGRFLRYNVAVQRRILHKLFDGIVSLKQIEAIRTLAHSASQAKRIYLGKKFNARKEGDLLIFSSSSEKRTKKFEYKMRVPGKNALEELNLTVNTRIMNSRPVLDTDASTVYFDVDKINLKDLRLRNRREGDRFKPFGLKGMKKLSDFFIDEKIPRYLRDRVPLLVEGNDILWVIGFRRGDKARITKNTGKILEVEVIREKEETLS